MPYAADEKGYQRPYMTDSLGFDTRPMLCGMLAELEEMAGVGEDHEEAEAAE